MGGLMIPQFDSDGNLPPGIYEGTWDEFVSRFGWTVHRQKLIIGLKKALESLRNAGCLTVYIDGSFVTSKEIPEDYDACWDIYNVQASLVDPVLLIFDNGRAAQKAKFLGELFPATFIEAGSGQRFLDFFQIDKRTNNPKGIIKINLGGLP